jgi:hypothetical protein
VATRYCSDPQSVTVSSIILHIFLIVPVAINTKRARNKLHTDLSINADREVLISGRGLGYPTNYFASVVNGNLKSVLPEKVLVRANINTFDEGESSSGAIRNDASIVQYYKEIRF